MPGSEYGKEFYVLSVEGWNVGKSVPALMKRRSEKVSGGTTNTVTVNSALSDSVSEGLLPGSQGGSSGADSPVSHKTAAPES